MVERLVRESKNGVLLSLRVSHGAKSTLLHGTYGDAARKVRIAAPPTGGRANAEIEELMAGLFGIAPSSIEIVQGTSGRDKVVLFHGAEPPEIRRRISALIR